MKNKTRCAKSQRFIKSGFSSTSTPTLSYWEKNSFLSGVDVLLIGSGIVGLNAAIALKKQAPQLKVTILEKGVLPAGASTRNAGFACFGSMTELLDDIDQNGEEAMLQLVEKRWKGLQRLLQITGREAIRYQPTGGYELFLPEQEAAYRKCLDHRAALNKALASIIGVEEVFEVRNDQLSDMGFGRVKQLLYNRAEGQVDTGELMRALLTLARQHGVELFNGCGVDRVEDNETHVRVICANGWQIEARKVLVCTNGFASQLLPHLLVEPARNQVLITHPVDHLPFEGCFHYDRGYFYFRNVGNRVLLGGGRHLAKAEEKTTEFQTTPYIQKALTTLLEEVILPNQNCRIEKGWTGIMGVGPQKAPIVEAVSPNVFAAVRLGGMGVALGSLIGEEGAGLVLEKM